MVQDETPFRKPFPHEAESYSSLKLAAKYLRLKIRKHGSLVCNTTKQGGLQKIPSEKTIQNKVGSLFDRVESRGISRTPRSSILSPPRLSSCGSIETIDISSPEQSTPTPFLNIAENESSAQDDCEDGSLGNHENMIDGLINDMMNASSINKLKLNNRSLTYVQAQGQRNWRYDSDVASDLFVQATLIPC